MAEILSVKEQNGHILYYVHYIDCKRTLSPIAEWLRGIITRYITYFKDNKRLDEWVLEDRLNLKKMQLPKKEATTPKKGEKNGSRPTTPDKELVSVLANLNI